MEVRTGEVLEIWEGGPVGGPSRDPCRLSAEFVLTENEK